MDRRSISARIWILSEGQEFSHCMIRTAVSLCAILTITRIFRRCMRNFMGSRLVIWQKHCCIQITRQETIYRRIHPAMKLCIKQIHLHRSLSKRSLWMYATAVPSAVIFMRAISRRSLMIINVRSAQFQRICL